MFSNVNFYIKFQEFCKDMIYKLKKDSVLSQSLELKPIIREHSKDFLLPL